MKIKVAVEARIDARDRRRCLQSCPQLGEYPFGPGFYCQAKWGTVDAAWQEREEYYDLDTDSQGHPLRCRMCLRREVSP